MFVVVNFAGLHIMEISWAEVLVVLVGLVDLDIGGAVIMVET